ncbi:MAG: GNAT family N-acetyltransferase [Chloroflexota bacterium]|nr:GNAT family N-acetyltransferase [Chloroflexota bacterium]MDE2840739.1 GNAT family N-acetyltransferase [Chloroflexota bacterium]MDE2931783.1 GNAT family N-acetyltransferase [Chloroflexota bacterium]
MHNRDADEISIRRAESHDDYRAFTDLACEYLDSLGFEVDFQDVDREMAEAQRRYGEAGRGAALLVVNRAGEVVGIAALRDLGAGACELKRMYVKPTHRGSGIGRSLCETAICVAQRLGYQTMRLDTMRRMTAATRLYESLGFRRIQPYTLNPLPDAQFYERELDTSA